MASGSFVEVEHAQMGEEHIVLVNEGAALKPGKTLYGPGGSQDVGKALTEIAQPGFTRLTAEELPGVPTGWAVYRGVRNPRPACRRTPRLWTH